MSSVFAQILEFCGALDERRASYVLRAGRPETIMLSVAVPGERWEIEFFEDGTLEVERFVSIGVEERPDALSAILSYFDEQ